MNSHTLKSLTRRKLIQGALLTASASVTGLTDQERTSPSGIQNRVKQRIFRFAHMTDLHINDRRNAPQGLVAALRHVHSLEDQPQMIITGGDHVMDVLGAVEERATIQYDLVKQIFRDECRLPIEYCIGNHDVWGWDKNSKTTGDEPLWGKKRPLQEFGLSTPYSAFDRGPWRILLLDSILPSDGYYTARFDEEQFVWLAEELNSHADKYICLISHIPIFSAAALLDGENEKSGQWILPHQWMHLDARKLINLFFDHKNVKLCISGHLHLLERIEYNNVTYICDGAVCGAWWGGANQQCPEGYGLFDLYEDGTFDHVYTQYGWKHV